MRILGAVLAALGVLALLYGGFDYTREEKVLDLGPLTATAKREERFTVPPIVGGLVLAAGVGLFVASFRRR